MHIIPTLVFASAHLLIHLIGPAIASPIELASLRCIDDCKQSYGPEGWSCSQHHHASERRQCERQRYAILDACVKACLLDCPPSATTSPVQSSTHSTSSTYSTHSTTSTYSTDHSTDHSTLEFSSQHTAWPTRSTTSAFQVPTQTFTATVKGCDYTSFNLRCPGSATVSSGSVTYGRWDDTICPPATSVQTTVYYNETYPLPMQYTGSQRVKLDASDGLDLIIGHDPVFGVVKQVQIVYVCE